MQITATFVLAAVLALKTSSVLALPLHFASTSIDARDYSGDQAVFVARDFLDLERLEARTTTGSTAHSHTHQTTSHGSTAHGSSRQSVGSAGNPKPRKTHAELLADEQTRISNESKRLAHDTTHLRLEKQIDQDQSQLQKGDYRREYTDAYIQAREEYFDYLEARTITGSVAANPPHTHAHQTTIHGSSSRQSKPRKTHAELLADEQARINSESKRLAHDTTHLHLEKQIDQDRSQLQKGDYRREYNDAFIRAREEYFDYLEARTTTGSVPANPHSHSLQTTTHGSTTHGSAGTSKPRKTHAELLADEQARINGESKRLAHDATHLRLEKQIDQDRSQLQKGDY